MGSEHKPPPHPLPPPPPPSVGKTTAETGSTARKARQKAAARQGTQSTLLAGETGGAAGSVSRPGNSLLG